jgi:Ala-tRNA(Pro) deacylase
MDSRLNQFLSDNHIAYRKLSHPRTYTALETAHIAHIPSHEMTKTVVTKLDGQFVMVVMHANQRLDMERLLYAASALSGEIVPEHEFADLFRDCEPGAMPPFGNLYGLDVYVDEELMDDRDIAFNAGTHSELVRMAFRDYERLVQPKFASLNQH